MDYYLSITGIEFHLLPHFSTTIDQPSDLMLLKIYYKTEIMNTVHLIWIFFYASDRTVLLFLFYGPLLVLWIHEVTLFSSEVILVLILDWEVCNLLVFSINISSVVPLQGRFLLDFYFRKLFCPILNNS